MIARIWHGRTKIEDYEEYTELMITKAVPDYEKTAGFKKLSFLRNIEGNEGHFTLITYWEDIKAIKKFAGEDYNIPKYYSEDKKFLLEFENRVIHYEVFAEK